MNSHLTIGQVKRVLAQLVKEGYLKGENLPYGRTGKIVYRPTDRCDSNLSIASNRVSTALEVGVVVNA